MQHENFLNSNYVPKNQRSDLYVADHGRSDIFLLMIGLLLLVLVFNFTGIFPHPTETILSNNSNIRELKSAEFSDGLKLDSNTVSSMKPGFN